MIEITAQQAIEFKGVEILKDWYCLPIKDANGNWFIGQQEAHALGIGVVEGEYVASIYEEIMIGFSGYALIPTSETKELYPSLPYEIDTNGLEVVQWNIVYDDQYNYALAHLLTLVKTKYKPATLYPQNP